jgi:hypothetical protein
MKPIRLSALIVLLTAFGAGVALRAHASSPSTITVTPSDMKDGETKTYTDDGRTITIRRDGDTTLVKIEGAGETRSLSITKRDGAVVIDRGGARYRSLVVGPERRKMVIDGVPFGEERKLLRPDGERHRVQTWYVCPKDHTTLSVPDAKENKTYKCPVDGTTMEQRKGRGFSFFFDDDFFQSDAL